MKKKSILICFLIVALCPLLKAAVYPSKYLSAIDFDDAVFGLKWYLDSDLNPLEGRQIAVKNGKVWIFNSYQNGFKYFRGEGSVGLESGYLYTNDFIPRGWSITVDDSEHLIVYLTAKNVGYDLFNGFEAYVQAKVSGIDGIKKSTPISITEAQIADVQLKVGGFRYIFSRGDLSKKCYIYACGGKPKLVSGGMYDEEQYDVTQTNCMVRFEINNFTVTDIKYYKDPLFCDNAILFPINDNEILVNSSLHDESGDNIKSFVYRVYRFDLNNGKGGWGPEIIMPNDIRKGGIRKTAVGGCFVEIRDCKVYFYNTGARTGDVKSNRYKYSQYFTGYDYTAYDPNNPEPIKNCYYYKNYKEMMPGIDASPLSGSFANFILPEKVTEDEYNIYHYSPDGSYVACYKLYVKTRGDAFKGALGMNVTPQIIKADYDVTDLEVNVEWLAPSDPENTTKGKQTLLGYELDLVEYGVDKPVATVQVPKGTLKYTFKEMKPLLPNAGVIADTPTQGVYTVRLRARYEWSEVYDGNNLVYYFDSEDAVRECQPDYEVSEVVQNIKTKTIWVPDSPFPGGVTPARAYTVIDFDAPAQGKNKELPTFWRVYAEKNNEITEIDSIPGNFNFLTDKNNVQKQFGGNEEKNIDYVFVHEVLNVPSAEIAGKLGYKYYIEAVYADNSPAARKRVKQGPYEVAGSVPTGVYENKYNDLAVTPTLVDDVMNVSCGQEINSIDIYSLSGALVLHLECNGNVQETIYVDELASGTYLVKVNDYKVVKFIKR